MTFKALMKACLILLGIFSGLLPMASQASAPDYLVKRYNGGEAYAAYIIGNRYRLGVGGAQDPAEARIWYEKAAIGGVIEAQFTLAWMYSHKSQDDRDFDAAVAWLIAAEDNDDRIGPDKENAYKKAQKRLAWICKKGYADFPKGHRYADDPKCWAARGQYLYSARYGEGGLSEFLKPSESSPYREKTRDYLERALVAGEGGAADTLAHIEGTGWGVPKNTMKASTYLEQAGEEASGEGNYHLSKAAIERGDIAAAVRQAELGAQKGSKRAARMLGRAYLNGDNVTRNEALGLRYLMVGDSRSSFTGGRRGLDAYIPFITEAPPILVLYRCDNLKPVLSAAHQDALYYANQFGFSDRRIDDISAVYSNAIVAYEYYHERGAVWHTSRYWKYIFWRFLPIFGMLIFSIIIWLFLRKSGVRYGWVNW